MAIIKEWMIIDKYAIFTKPDTNGVMLCGKVFKDFRSGFSPEYSDGKVIYTQEIKEFDWEKREAKTVSGDTYKLEGKAERKYIDWLIKVKDIERFVEMVLPKECMN